MKKAAAPGTAASVLVGQGDFWYNGIEHKGKRGVIMYDFDAMVDRTFTGASKWAQRSEYERAHGIVPMSVADMEFQAPPCVREAVERAARHGIYGYTDRTEAYDLAVIHWMARRHNLAVQPQDIVALNGVVPALGVAVRAFTQPGDGVIFQPPVYHPFRMTIERNGRTPMPCPLKLTGRGYEMDFEALERAASRPRTSLMLLCSPHNPVGRVWSREELTRLEQICRANGVFVISDEIHADLVLHGPHTAFPNLSPQARANCIVCTAPSKTFNIPGLQTANIMVCNGDNRERFSRQARIDGCEGLSYFGYAATIAAYEGGEDWLEAALAYIEGNYEALKSFFQARMPQVRLLPMEGTYLAWADMRGLGMDAQALERFMRQEAHMILDEGYIFGQEGEGFERFNLALPRQELTRQLQRLGQAWDRR